MGPISSPETSVRNYHYLLRNIPEGRSSHEFGSFTRAFILNLKSVHKLTATNFVILLRIVKYPAMLRHVDWWIVTDVSEQRSHLFGLTDAKAGSIVFPETSVTIYQSTRRSVSEDSNVH